MAKRPKRMSKKELQQPDEVQVALKGLWDGLEKYWRYLVAGAAALVVLGGIGTLVASLQESSRQETADELSKALAPLASPIGEPPADPAALPAGTETFESIEAARKAASERLAAFLAEHEGGDVAKAATFLRSALDPAGVAALEGFLAEEPDHVLAPAGWMAIAEAKAKAGERDAALATYRKVADAATGTLKAMALLAAGDLQNPLAVEGGNAAEAKKAYEEAKAALLPRPEASPGDLLGAAFGEPYAYAEIGKRLALLP